MFENTEEHRQFFDEVRLALVNSPRGPKHSGNRQTIHTVYLSRKASLSQSLQNFIENVILTGGRSSRRQEFITAHTMEPCQRLWRQMLADRKCSGCGKPLLSVHLLAFTPPQCCSYECVGASVAIWEKRKRTYRAETGYDFASQNPSVKKQKTDTSLRRLGVVNPSQSPWVKAKKAETNLRRRGVSNPAQDPSVIARAQATNLERYGVRHPMLNPIVAGRRHHGGYKLHTATRRGKVYTVQGRAELELLCLLLDIYGAHDIYTQYDVEFRRVQESCQPLGFWADFYIKPKGCLLEVKSLWTFFCGHALSALDTNRQKASACGKLLRWAVQLVPNLPSPDKTNWVILPLGWEQLKTSDLVRQFPTRLHSKIFKMLMYRRQRLKR